MEAKTRFITLTAWIALTVLLFQSCKKDEEKTNQLPTCTITSPINGQQVTKGETLTISVDANDIDGSIAEVRFLINDVGKGSSASFPFNYNWNTNNENTGNYTLKATSIDNSGGSSTDEISIELTEGGGATGTFIDSRDGQTYITIDIGSQIWFAENLSYETPDSWLYNNSSTNGDIYGRLYAWNAALTACPSGWHLPSDAEWTVLTNFLGGESIAGGKMKEVGTAHWNSPNAGATNSSGFAALPGGNSSSGETFNFLGNLGYWWSSTEDSDTYSDIYSWSRSLSFAYGQTYRISNSTTWGFSVRCIKD